MIVKVKTLDHFDRQLELPSYKTPYASGADIRACLGRGEKIMIKPAQRVLVPTGLVFEIPQGYEIQVRPRSGLSYKTGLMIVNGPGTVDSDYRGEIKIILGNLGNRDEIISHGDRIAQLILAPVLQAQFQQETTLASTQRGTGGFGSTGLK